MAPTLAQSYVSSFLCRLVRDKRTTKGFHSMLRECYSNLKCSLIDFNSSSIKFYWGLLICIWPFKVQKPFICSFLVAWKQRVSFSTSCNCPKTLTSKAHTCFVHNSVNFSTRSFKFNFFHHHDKAKTFWHLVWVVLSYSGCPVTKMH